MKTTNEIINGVTVINIDPGDTVLCDLCNMDYTNRDETGGFLFSGKAVCPKCSPAFLQSVKKYKEEIFIKSTAREGESFRAFVYRIRRGEY